MFALLSAISDLHRSAKIELGIEHVAHHLAVAYQIANDLNDLVPWVESNVDETPKDVANGSPSLPLLLAWHSYITNQVHPREVRIAWSGRESYLRGLLRQSDIIQRCHQQMRRSLESAVACIHSAWPVNPYSQLFLGLCSSKWLRSYLGKAIEALTWEPMNTQKELTNEYKQ